MDATEAVSDVKEGVATPGVAAESVTTKCYLDDLSSEARSKIWELVLVGNPSVFIAIDTIPQPNLDFTEMVTEADISETQQLTTLPSILQTSRQIRSEALPIFLAHNTFNFNLHKAVIFDACDEPLDDEFNLGVLTTHLDSLSKIALHFSIGQCQVRVELDGGEVDLSVGQPGYRSCDEVSRSEVEAEVSKALPCGEDIGARNCWGV